MKIFVSFTIIFIGQTSCSWAFTLSTEVFSSAAAFEELKSLKFKQREKYKRMYGYLDTMRNMRNDESHVTPDASEEEIDASSRIVTTLYLYITANSITELEMSGKI